MIRPAQPSQPFRPHGPTIRPVPPETQEDGDPQTQLAQAIRKSKRLETRWKIAKRCIVDIGGLDLLGMVLNHVYDEEIESLGVDATWPAVNDTERKLTVPTFVSDEPIEAEAKITHETPRRSFIDDVFDGLRGNKRQEKH